MYYVIDRLEHGNGGVYGHEVLGSFETLLEAMYFPPQHYEVTSKEFGFWPVISESKSGKDPVATWDDEKERWKLL